LSGHLERVSNKIYRTKLLQGACFMGVDW
jgi:hypothetical protein